MCFENLIFYRNNKVPQFYKFFGPKYLYIQQNSILRGVYSLNFFDLALRLGVTAVFLLKLSVSTLRAYNS